MRVLLVSSVLLFQLAMPALAQTDLERCAAATPQFPHACPCVIQNSERAGISSETLSRLLSNDTASVPFQTFQQYGAIYVQCIQEAVLSSAGGGVALSLPTSPSLPEATVPQIGVQPVQQTPITHIRDISGLPVQGPIIEGISFEKSEIAPLTMFMREAVEPGSWANVSMYRGSGIQRGGPGVHDGQGHMLMLECRPVYLTSRPFMVLGGVSVSSATAPVSFSVMRGNGEVLIDSFARALAVDGPFLIMELTTQTADAIRTGNLIRFKVSDGPDF